MPSGVVSQAVSVPSDPGVDVARAASAPASALVPPTSTSLDLRLNIVRDHDSGLFVYKFIDPTTGQVVRQLPDEEIVKLRAAAEYAAGRLISTRA